MGSPLHECRASALAACLAWLVAGGAVAQKVVVLSSADTPRYQEAIAGMRKLDASVDVLRIASDDDAPPIVEADTVVVTLGGPAAMVASRIASTVPKVDCALDLPVDAQVVWLKRLLPNVRTIGILFDPAQNERRASEAAAALTRAGYVSVLEPVTGPTSLPAALNRFGDRVDVVLGLPDATVYAREHSRALFLYSFRHRVPVVGPSESWVKKGALYALDWDYADLGRYCGTLALRELHGGKPPAAPRTRIVANARSAEQLRINWDAETLHSLDKVYQ